MVCKSERTYQNNTKLVANIENFIHIDMAEHNIDYSQKQTFKRQLHYAIFILDGKTEECQEDQDCFRQEHWDNARLLIQNENSMVTMTNSFTKHGAMYARVLYSCFSSNMCCIDRINKFIDAPYTTSSPKSCGSTSNSNSSSSSSSSSDGS